MANTAKVNILELLSRRRNNVSKPPSAPKNTLPPAAQRTDQVNDPSARIHVERQLEAQQSYDQQALGEVQQLMREENIAGREEVEELLSARGIQPTAENLLALASNIKAELPQNEFAGRLAIIHVYSAARIPRPTELIYVGPTTPQPSNVSPAYDQQALIELNALIVRNPEGIAEVRALFRQHGIEFTSENLLTHYRELHVTLPNRSRSSFMLKLGRIRVDCQARLTTASPERPAHFDAAKNTDQLPLGLEPVGEHVSAVEGDVTAALIPAKMPARPAVRIARVNFDGVEIDEVGSRDLNLDNEPTIRDERILMEMRKVAGEERG